MAKDNNRIGNDLGLMSVAVVRFNAIGDVTMTIPLVYSACMSYPSVRYVMLTRQSIEDLFVNKPDNLTVVGVDLTQYSGISGANRLVAMLRDTYHIDALVDLQDSSLTRLMRLRCRLAGVKTSRVTTSHLRHNALTRRTNKVMLPMVSARARYREALFSVGLPIEECFESLYAGGKAPADQFANITTLPKHGCWVGIAPFAMYPQKEYPTDKMEEVIHQLAGQDGYHIFLFGGDGREKECADRWADKYPNITSLAGSKYGFSSELALMSNLDVMLTMDSANMHLASMVGTPTISVWGATHHYCGYKGWRQNSDDMVQVPLSCRPCSVNGNKECYRHDLLCLTAIRPETIYNKLMDTVRSTRNAHNN